MGTFNFLGSNYDWIIYSYIIDIIVLVLAIGLFVGYYIYDRRKAKKQKNFKYPPLDSNVRKVDDDTYLIEKQKAPEEYKLSDLSDLSDDQTNDNAVEHFSTQLTDISQPGAENLRNNVVVEEKQVESKSTENENKAQIGNFVNMNSSVKNNKKPTSTYNHGSSAYSEATNFFSTIKQENADIKSFEEKPKTKTAKTKAKSTSKSTAKSSTTRSTSSTKTATKSAKTAT